jgi:carbon-monoxide dehydrogenase medium subunit
MPIQDHLFPTSLSEALEMLSSAAGKGRVIAGGTDLVPEIREGSHHFEILVDLSRISGLAEIEEEGSLIRLGTLVTMAQAERSGLLQKKATALAEAASWVGGPQIRNRATFAGNIVSAQPAADGAIALLALDAELHILSPQGEKTMRLAEAYAGVGRSMIDPSREIITAIEFTSQLPEQSSAFRRKARRKAMALPELNCAVWLSVQEGICRNVRISIGPVSSTPMRAQRAEKILTGNLITDEFFSGCARLAREESNPRDSALRGSGRYRKSMVEILVKEALVVASQRLGGNVR